MDNVKSIKDLTVAELKLCLAKHKISFKSNALKAELSQLLTHFASVNNFKKVDPNNANSDYAIDLTSLTAPENLENSRLLIPTPEPVNEAPSSLSHSGSNQTSFQQTQKASREPPFSEVIKMTSAIRFCESRSPVAIEH